MNRVALIIRGRRGCLRVVLRVLASRWNRLVIDVSSRTLLAIPDRHEHPDNAPRRVLGTEQVILQSAV